MDLIHKTCKNNFTILWFQVNSLGVSLNWTAPSLINLKDTGPCHTGGVTMLGAQGANPETPGQAPSLSR